MENPATWTEPVKVISKAIGDWITQMNEEIVGYSEPMFIYRALKEAGFIIEIKKNPTNMGGDNCYTGRKK
jgi:hypothetical protein